MIKFIKVVLMSLVTFLTYSQQHTFTGFSPTYAGIGDIVTLTGTNFIGVTNVTFGGTSASSFTVVNSTTIKAVVGSGTTGFVGVLKTGFTTITRIGFTYSTVPTITGVITDFSGYWNTNTTTPNSTLPDDAHNLLSFTYQNKTYSTGVNDAILTSNSITFSSQDFRGLPVTLTGNTNTNSSDNSGNPQYIIASSKIDGNSTSADYTSNNIKNLTLQSVLTDGLKGLGLGTGYTNLKINSTSNYNVKFINTSGINDSVPDILVTQIAEPTGTTIDTYKFLDSVGNIVGDAISGIDLSKLNSLGSYYCDLYTIPFNTSNSTAKPSGNNTSRTNRPIRFLAFRLSDFGITLSNYNLVDKLQIISSGKSDVAFVGYNAETIYSLPLVSINSISDTVFCSGESPLIKIDVVAPGETLTYQWESSNDGGLTWGELSGFNSDNITPPSPFYGEKIRCKVTTSNGYFSYSSIFTLSGCLPVELSSFNGQCTDEGNKLTWKTDSEHNSAYFELQSSRNGENWLLINKQNAAGNSTEEISYYYIDTNYFSNMLYRLIQVDFNGDFKIYEPIFLDCDITNSFYTYPNPSIDKINIFLDYKYIGDCEIIILDCEGRKVLSKNIQVLEGMNQFEIDDNLKPGVYFIKINDKILKHIKR